ncbi:MAG: response regulator [candidate division NC10 bacterium]|nr:response regulator [candidate division NC10 bacterium]
MDAQTAKARILVVDDEEPLRQALRDALAALGYGVSVAASGEEALQLLRERKFEMMLSDISMPGMSGIELLSLASQIHPDMPVVLLTGYGDVELARSSLQKGAGDFITKPLKLNELPIVIERNLERKRLEIKRLKEKEAQVLFQAIKALAAAIDAKEHYTAQHSQRVTQLSLILADALDLEEDQCYALELAAQMHDVGKIGIPDTVLSKVGKLTPEEWHYMRGHPAKGAEIVGQIEELSEVSSIIRHHHERMDGGGYPDGLKGEAIPLLARIIAIADAYEAMTTDRAYRRARTREQALAELRNQKGAQFDARLVEVFARALSGLPEAPQYKVYQ